MKEQKVVKTMLIGASEDRLLKLKVSEFKDKTGEDISEAEIVRRLIRGFINKI